MKQDLTIDIDSEFEEGKSNSELVRGTKALKNMLLNLFKTLSQYGDSLGDRPYEPTYGCNLEKYLFEPLDTSVGLEIRDDLYDSITTFLPEYYVTRSTIIVTPLYDQDAYKIYIAYVYLGNPSDIELVVSRKITRI